MISSMTQIITGLVNFVDVERAKELFLLPIFHPFDYTSLQEKAQEHKLQTDGQASA